MRPGDPALSFAERFGLLVERRWSAREEGRLARRLERAVFLDLAELSFLGGAGNVILTGATGLGNTYLACALADRAARRGHSVL